MSKKKGLCLAYRIVSVSSLAERRMFPFLVSHSFAKPHYYVVRKIGNTSTRPGQMRLIADLAVGFQTLKSIGHSFFHF